MEFILIVAAFILTQNYTPVHAAPSIEACPPDSILADDTCKCNPESCLKPPCLATLTLAVNGSDLPGSCCPEYDCVGCNNDTLIDGKCPCAPGAVLKKNRCECVDEEKHLVNGECVCNPSQCKLPALCGKKSVAVTVKEGCCKKVICKPCPSDSESTYYLETDELEDHCVCLPCKTECGNNRTVEIKKRGTGLPGNCCDLYECKNLDEMKGCYINNIFYKNGEKWLTSDRHQECKCQNGVSFCTNIIEPGSQFCFKDDKIYKHLETWTKEDGCTFCTCLNGEAQCISHFCEVKESQIQKNDSQPCLVEDRIYQHLDSWRENDNCTNCTCINGEEKCSDDLCSTKTDIKKNECQPLANCNKTCLNGFKINKKGCEICKCNSIKFVQDILVKYNITMKDLIAIVENYVHQRTSTSTTPTTGTTTTPIVDSVSTVDPVFHNIEKILEETLSSPTTESCCRTSVVPADKDANYWNIALPILALLSIACVGLIIIIVMCIYKNRRKSSLDLSHCHYETVNNLNNNNTIKKTDQLL